MRYVFLPPDWQLLLVVYIQGSLHCKQKKGSCSLLFVTQLYYRSVDIISELSGAGKEVAGTALLRAIYRDDNAEKVRRWNIPRSFSGLEESVLFFCEWNQTSYFYILQYTLQYTFQYSAVSVSNHSFLEVGKAWEQR